MKLNIVSLCNKNEEVLNKVDPLYWEDYCNSCDYFPLRPNTNGYAFECPLKNKIKWDSTYAKKCKFYWN